MKHCTSWIYAQERKLGPWLEEFPAWAKVKAALTADPVMRTEVLRCMAGKIPLDKAEGIAECHMVTKKALAYKADAEQKTKPRQRRRASKQPVRQKSRHCGTRRPVKPSLLPLQTCWGAAVQCNSRNPRSALRIPP